jgi:hypothetical protein
MKIERFGSGSISQRHGSADPDPHQNAMDPQLCSTQYGTACSERKQSGLRTILGTVRHSFLRG